MDILWTDFETRSFLNLKEVGLDRYAKDSSTEILMLAYALNNEEPKLWLPHCQPFPDDLKRHLEDQSIRKGAWNYNFEKDIFEFKLNIIIPQSLWIDPSVLCAYMSLPIGLKRAGQALNIHGKKIIINGDERPVKLFGQLTKPTKKQAALGKFPYYKDWNSHPEKWSEFEQYCIQDIRAEREVYYEVLSFHSPLTEEEFRAWELDQRMNSTGVYVDKTFVINAKSFAEVEANSILSEMKEITNLDNPNSRNQMLEWLQTKGYPFNSIDVESVESGLLVKGLSPEAYKILELKQKLGGSAYKKLESILQRIGPDSRLRDQFVYHGAHTGRWAGRGVQLQNLYKTDSQVAKDLDKFVKAIRDREIIEGEIPIMTVIASTVRASFTATPGNKLVVGDLAQIESRVLAAISNCRSMIEAYARGHDLYKEFMAWLLKKPVSEITKDERARGKVVILGCGFQMGWEKFQTYALSFNITLTEEQAKEAVYGFREKYPEIKMFWDNLNKAVIRAVKIGIAVYLNGLVIDGRDSRMLKIKLPSGRYLHYLDPRVITKKTPWGKMQDSVDYTAFDNKGKQVKSLYGGLLTENVVQAMARDLLLNGMFLAEKEAEKSGGKLVMTIHDEIVIDTPIEGGFSLDKLLDCMKTVPEWGKDMGFTLSAEGWEGGYYKK